MAALAAAANGTAGLASARSAGPALAKASEAAKLATVSAPWGTPSGYSASPRFPVEHTTPVWSSVNTAALASPNTATAIEARLRRMSGEVGFGWLEQPQHPALVS